MFEGTIVRIFFVLTIWVLVEGDYAPSPQNPFVNTTYIPPPPPSLPPTRSPAPPSPSSASYFTTKSLVLIVVGTTLGTLVIVAAVGVAIWFVVKYYRKRKLQRGQQGGR